MSLILDALKKIEKDKARLREPEMDIASAILQPGGRRQRDRRSLSSAFFCSAAVILVFAGAAVTYLVAEGGERHRPAAHSKTDLPADIAGQPQTTGKSASDSPQAVNQKGASREVSAWDHDQEAEPPGGISARTLPEVRKARQASVPTLVNSKRVEAARVESSEALPALRISGIVWMEERGERRALINGGSLKEGDTVEGVRVERIDPGLIRFSRSGKSFEVTIEQK